MEEEKLYTHRVRLLFLYDDPAVTGKPALWVGEFAGAIQRALGRNGVAVLLDSIPKTASDDAVRKALCAESGVPVVLAVPCLDALRDTTQRDRVRWDPALKELNDAAARVGRLDEQRRVFRTAILMMGVLNTLLVNVKPLVPSLPGALNTRPDSSTFRAELPAVVSLSYRPTQNGAGEKVYETADAPFRDMGVQSLSNINAEAVRMCVFVLRLHAAPITDP